MPTLRQCITENVISELVDASKALWHLHTPWWGPGSRRHAACVATMGRRFSEALAELPPQRAIPLRSRIRRACSPVDFWHLRVDVFNAVSRSLGQQVAQCRLAELDTLFVSGGPRSGPLPLDSRS